MQYSFFVIIDSFWNLFFFLNFWYGYDGFFWQLYNFFNLFLCCFCHFFICNLWLFCRLLFNLNCFSNRCLWGSCSLRFRVFLFFNSRSCKFYFILKKLWNFNCVLGYGLHLFSWPNGFSLFEDFSTFIGFRGFKDICFRLVEWSGLNFHLHLLP